MTSTGFTQADLDRIVQAAIDNAQDSLDVKDVLSLLGGIAIMQQPATGMVTCVWTLGPLMALETLGWVVVMNRREAFEILLTGTAHDVLRVLTSRIARPLAAA